MKVVKIRVTGKPDIGEVFFLLHEFLKEGLEILCQIQVEKGNTKPKEKKKVCYVTGPRD